MYAKLSPRPYSSRRTGYYVDLAFAAVLVPPLLPSLSASCFFVLAHVVKELRHGVVEVISSRGIKLFSENVVPCKPLKPPERKEHAALCSSFISRSLSTRLKSMNPRGGIFPTAGVAHMQGNITLPALEATLLLGYSCCRSGSTPAGCELFTRSVVAGSAVCYKGEDPEQGQQHFELSLQPTHSVVNCHFSLL
jgi:hypothetical protein